MSKTLFISPHDDDQALFGAFICMNEHPVVAVVTDSYVQTNRGEVGCDAETRAEETRKACEILGCPVVRMRIRDDVINEWNLEEKFRNFQGFERVFIPALQGGSSHHDLVNIVAKRVFGDKVMEYTTYTRTELYTEGDIEIRPDQDDLDLKERALACYTSQINLSSTRPHFEAVKGKSEWLIKKQNA